MSWGEGATMQARFAHATEVGHDLHPHWRLGDSYGGFTAAWAKHSATLTSDIVHRFQRQMHRMAGPRWLVRGWCVFAADGTRIETPHTAANEAGLGCAGREKSAPQVFLTSLWHMGLGIPWDFRTGPGTDSERRHLEDMLDGLPAGSMIVADAGFCGYRLCQNMIQRGHSFLLRVGSNVTLLSQLGYHVERDSNTVYLWPEDFRDQPPLVLRLIVLQRGKQTIYLLTNVLDPAELSDDDAAALYEMRWGIEVGYRSYKQTLDRRTMKSRTPTLCLLESQWTMLGLWLLGLLSLAEQLPRGCNPRRWSAALARNAVRCAMRRPTCRCRHDCLATQLRNAVHDSYTRLRAKDARNYPRKKREKPPGPPKIKPATPHQIRLATKLREKLPTTT